MTVTVNRRARAGTYTITVKGTGGGVTTYDYRHSYHPVVAVKRFGTRCLGGMR